MCGTEVSVSSPEESGPAIGVGPGEGHVADAEFVVGAQEAERVFDGVAAFDAHEHGAFVLATSGFDVGGGGREGYLGQGALRPAGARRQSSSRVRRA